MLNKKKKKKKKQRQNKTKKKKKKKKKHKYIYHGIRCLRKKTKCHGITKASFIVVVVVLRPW